MNANVSRLEWSCVLSYPTRTQQQVPFVLRTSVYFNSSADDTVMIRECGSLNYSNMLLVKTI